MQLSLTNLRPLWAITLLLAGCVSWWNKDEPPQCSELSYAADEWSELAENSESLTLSECIAACPQIDLVESCQVLNTLDDGSVEVECCGGEAHY